MSLLVEVSRAVVNTGWLDLGRSVSALHDGARVLSASTSALSPVEG